MLKITLIALAAAAVLAMAPIAGFAQGCDHERKQQATSCADGYGWDAQAGACVPLASS